MDWKPKLQFPNFYSHSSSTQPHQRLQSSSLLLASCCSFPQIRSRLLLLLLLLRSRLLLLLLLLRSFAILLCLSRLALYPLPSVFFYELWCVVLCLWVVTFLGLVCCMDRRLVCGFVFDYYVIMDFCVDQSLVFVTFFFFFLGLSIKT